MNQAFTFISDEEITCDDVISMLQQAGGTVHKGDAGYLGYLEYNNVPVGVFISDIASERDEEIREEQKALGASPRSVISLEASSEDASISYQLVYDFCWMFMQRYHCIVDTHLTEYLDENDPEATTLTTPEMVWSVCEQRAFSRKAPPLYERQE